MSYPIRHHFPTLGFTSPHMTDKSVHRQTGHVEGAVTEAQQLLHGDGAGHFGNYHPGPIDGEYGGRTANAARRAHFWLGYPRSRVNRHFGAELRSHLLPVTHPQHTRLPRTYALRRKARLAMHKLPAWFKPPAPSNLGARMYNVAATQVGVKESPFGSNHVKYTDWYGFAGPWCAMFLSWCAHQAGSHNAAAGARWAAVEAVCADAQAGRNGLHVVNSHEVRRGDWCPFHFTEPFQHIEMFDHWIQPGVSFATIGGNTGPVSQSNGGEVARGGRFMSQLYFFVRLES